MGNMERCPKLVIQEAYGELSRAFKKLKLLETDPVKRSAYGDLAKAYRKLRAKSKAEDKPPPALFQMKWASAKEYMASGKILWGCNFYDKFLTACVKDAIRGDRFKNRWVADVNGRRGWRTGPEGGAEHRRTGVPDHFQPSLRVPRRVSGPPGGTQHVGEMARQRGLLHGTAVGPAVPLRLGPHKNKDLPLSLHRRTLPATAAPRLTGPKKNSTRFIKRKCSPPKF